MERNEPERWAQAKFTKDRWARLNNNANESWNNWMCYLRSMPILWLVMEHPQKIGLKFDKRKKEIQQWKNGAESKIERKLRETLALVGTVMEITLFSSTNGDYELKLINN